MPNVFDWWIKLVAVLRTYLSGSAKLSDAIILELEGQDFYPVVRVNGVATRHYALKADAAGIQMLAQLLASDPKLPRNVLFRPASSQMLHKSVSMPAAARRDLERVLEFEIDRETPFNRNEVYWTYTVRRSEMTQGALDVHLVLVPRSLLDGFLTALKTAGVEPSGIEVDSGPASRVVIPLASEKNKPWFRIERPLVPFAATAAALAVLILIAPMLVRQWVLFSTDATIASLTGSAREAATLRQSVDSATRAADFLVAERKKNRSVVAILAAVTDALPDNTHLTSLSVHSGKLTLSGLSSSAADLIGMLADIPGFSSPAFEAPVVRNDNNLESFTISVSLSEAGTS
jgi:general secretion pathway protein L